MNECGRQIDGWMGIELGYIVMKKGELGGLKEDMMDELLDGGVAVGKKKRQETWNSRGNIQVRKTMKQGKKSRSGHPVQITIKAFPFDSLFFPILFFLLASNNLRVTPPSGIPALE